MGETVKANRYEVVFSGRLMPGFTEESAQAGILGSSLLSMQTASGIPFDGSNVVLYASNSKRLAFEASRKFSSAGLRCKVRRKADRPSQPPPGYGLGALDYALIVFIVVLTALSLRHLMAGM